MGKRALRHGDRKKVNRRTVLAGMLGAGGLGALGTNMWKNRSVSLPSAMSVLNELPDTGRMPAVFVGHGTPYGAIRPGEYTERWSEIGRALPEARAILMISAHWLSRGGVMVTANQSPRMNYDMYGFPEEMYQIQYAAPGNPQLATDIGEAIQSQTRVHLDSEWGYDHGTWLPLMYMFPEASIPLIQLSIDYSQPPAFHFELAAQLTQLRSKGVLVMGSGNMVHNLRQRGPAGQAPFDWAEEFDSRITGHIQDGDYQSVVNFLDMGAVASSAHPTYDHFLPLLYVLGAQTEGDRVTTFNVGFQEPSVSMKSFVVV
jgi:4,5-DOPA dioxygenase extradiol